MVQRDGARRHEPRRTPVGAGAPPSGRELERERVAELQRSRMLDAMCELSRELGPERVTVSHVVARAGVSRRTFYELFDDREACFIAALDRAIAQVAAAVVPAYRGERAWAGRMRAGLTTMLELFDAEPGLAALCVVDSLAAGPRALERRGEAAEKLIDAVDRGRRESPAGAVAGQLGGAPAGDAGPCVSSGEAGAGALNRIAAEGVVGAVLAVLHTRLLAKQPRPLLGLSGRLMGMVVLPYLGPGAAAAELARPAPRARRTTRAHVDPLRQLPMRLTYRTMRVLAAIEAGGGLSNRQVARAADVADQGQISKLLQRLVRLELIRNDSGGSARGEANCWVLTERGAELAHALTQRGAVESRLSR
ncbi:MAG TPA: TetR family transcriptional regulator [Solirubrobacteraceae bacterium]|nr:TetR family transcriptional regulator [Solirubrobacteraceae bacterium]